MAENNEITEIGNEENIDKENKGDSPRKNEEMVQPISEAIALSMQKFGEKLTDSLTQSLGYEDYEEYYEEDPLEESEETSPPPAKKHKGAFDVLNSILNTAAPTKAVENDNASGPWPAKPGEKIQGALVQGPPADPKIHGDQEYRIPIVDKQSNVRGEAVLHAIRQELDTEGTGQNVDTDLAELLESLFTTGVSEEKLREKMNLYIRPGNVGKLVPVKVNPVIWDGLGPHNRSQDLKMQKALTPLTKAMIAATEAAGVIRKHIAGNEELGEGLKKVLDSIVLMVSASKELNMRRRELIKPALNNEYAHLCTSNVPITEELFGADLSQQVKDITELNRVSQQLRGGRGRAAGGYRSRGRWPRRGSFLGRGASGSGSGRGRGGYRGRGGFRGRGRGGPNRGKSN